MPFFQPLWRRVAVIGVIACWIALEVVTGSFWWALIAAGVGAYSGYVLFFDFGSDDAANQTERNDD